MAAGGCWPPPAPRSMPRRWRFSRTWRVSALLIRNAGCVVTMDDAGAELRDTDIRIDNGEIIELGQGLDHDGPVIDARGCVVTPGLVNTHHHLFQTLTRAVPGGTGRTHFSAG
jgi:cytosine/adenosine deaminase-related metal-dependent hydrolase